jgi:alpha-L-fucosidase 2
MGMAAAHLQDHEMVEIMLQSMARNNYYITCASSHDFGPSFFNADISGGVPALILESIAQCSPVTDADTIITGYDILLLPAMPKSMSSGKLKGLRLRGGFILDLNWRDGKVIEHTVHNPQNKPYRVVSSIH